MMLTTPDSKALREEADRIERTLTSAREWVAATDAFDLIRAAMPPVLLAVVEEVRGRDLSCDELAGLLRREACK